MRKAVVVRIILSAILCTSLVMSAAPTKAASYPTELVNGDFSYPNILGTVTNWAYINTNGTWSIATGGSHSIAGWDAALFGWNATEIQIDKSGNVYGELCARTTDTAIYQDIQTTPGAIYKWSFKHCSRNIDFIDQMSVMIGSPASQTVQLATRMTTNGLPMNVVAGGTADTNQVGWQGTVISTPSTCNVKNPWDHESDWEYYEGTYEPPAGQTVTRFTYQAVAFSEPAEGNAIDMIQFKMAFPLYYHSDATSGSLPDPEGKGNYRGVYYEDEAVTVADNPGTLATSGYIFLGWSPSQPSSGGNDWLFDTAGEADSAGVVTSLTMPAGTEDLYAVWYRAPDSATPVPSDPDIPKTGDDNNATMLFITLGGSLLLLASLAYWWIKQQRTA